ncbi:MAG: Gfo/Idh/MocA family oxidoreductase, partial [bacterium]|nr:Gfo/Idh/MocA family oxidoreductase [bacterium]
MAQSSRRELLKKATLATGMAAAPAVRPAWGKSSPNDRVNVAVVGFHGRGRSHYREYAKMPNTQVAYLCDVDERLFPSAVAEVEKIGGNRPKTEIDFRKLIENKDLDAVSLATPDHWHGLQTVWGCQAGKDVYVEKPVCYTLNEGRKMVEASRKYNRMVQAGLNRRSDQRTRAAMKFIREGAFGDVYRVKAIIYKGRASIGRTQESSIPQGVHWDMYLGPAPYRAFNINRFHYGWHFFWDTSTADMGNTGVHHTDASRWGMSKNAHPVKVHCAGGYYLWDSDQETPNIQNAIFEYEDGTMMEVEVTNLYTPPMGGVRGGGEFYYTSKGYVSSVDGWKAVAGEFIPRDRKSPAGVDETMANASFPQRNYSPGPAIPPLEGEAEMSHFENFISCVRSRKREDLHCEILDGHMSTSLCHLANISYRTGRQLVFDPATETCPGDEASNSFLTREYREPYVMPD